jgi:UDP-N-acetylmuramoyl-L-alanyl-D-glutamate--2,6-diaminopimelate ligase
MKELLKKILPESFILAYHYCLAIFATFIYGYPSRKMVIIGVTGTKGKTSTANFIWACLNAGGHKTGIISTVNIRIGEKETITDYHMTMPGRFAIQKTLAEMVKAGCKFCVVETTSQGIKQYRHIGIDYDVAIFTNLSPEHIESHGGSFEEYKKMKGKMFAALAQSKAKKIENKKIKKTIIVNYDSEHRDYFLDFLVDERITYGLNEGGDFVAENIEENPQGIKFKVGESIFEINILGKFNVYNVLPAIIVARMFDVSDEDIAAGLFKLKIIPGRMEEIAEGRDFKVFVDYAHEKVSMTNALLAANNMKDEGGKVIVLLGAEGGGRDKAKRFAMGEVAAKMADHIIVSTIDPYEEDPVKILEDIVLSAEKYGKRRDENLFLIEDRREGIRKAISLAGAGDVVLITGKGAEQTMIVGKKALPWDDRAVVREELATYKVQVI